MSINWIDLDVALPRLKVTEYKDYVYFSDPVLVLCEDGFITTAKHEVFQDDDLTISNYFMSENDDLYEKHNAVIAWAPLSEVSQIKMTHQSPKKSKCNKRVREKIKECGLNQWEVAEMLGWSECYFSKKLRYELPEEEQTRIINTIEEKKGEKDESE